MKEKRTWPPTGHWSPPCALVLARASLSSVSAGDDQYFSFGGCPANDAPIFSGIFCDYNYFFFFFFFFRFFLLLYSFIFFFFFSDYIHNMLYTVVATCMHIRLSSL